MHRVSPNIRQTRDKVLQTPPIEWIEERISQFRELLEVNTNNSALALHNLLGSVKLEAKYPDIGKPYFLAYTSINGLVIAEPSPNCKSTYNGSTSFQWWARSQYRRTLYQLPLQITIYDPSEQPSYQNIAEKALQLKNLGLNYSSIARQLEVNHKTVSKAIEWISEFENKCI